MSVLLASGCYRTLSQPATLWTGQHRQPPRKPNEKWKRGSTKLGSVTTPIEMIRKRLSGWVAGWLIRDAFEKRFKPLAKAFESFRETLVFTGTEAIATSPCVGLILRFSDLKKAAELTKGKPDEVEPDGQPNARNIPTGTLQFNIWYHLGLAQYLTGRNKDALHSYLECLKVSKNPDALVATTHWLYMTLRRLNRPQRGGQNS